jgi:predicted CoA-binding protein/GNAT superfamily N-acetyltransferase
MITMPTGEFALLRDGSQVLIRKYDPADKSAVEDLLNRMSPESRAQRFHSGGIHIDDDLVGRVVAGHALLAEHDKRVVAVASFNRLVDPTAAELAIVVDDSEHGNGIGTVMFEHLSNDARREGIARVIAEVSAQNSEMLTLLSDLGFKQKRVHEGGIVQVEVDLHLDQEYFARSDERRHVAAVKSLDPLFHPRALAVVGASRRPGSIGQAVFSNLLQGGFEGAVYPVNPSAPSVSSVKAFPNVKSIPDTVDLAIIVVPAASVIEAARDCLDAGVKALVVISAGFAEVCAEGRARQNELLYLCQSYGAHGRAELSRRSHASWARRNQRDVHAHAAS